MTVRLRRSELSTPGSSAKMIAKAAASDADLVFLDLEDAVAPAQKVAARESVIHALCELDWGKKVRAVRVNDCRSVWAVDDVTAVLERAGENVDVLILPKVKAPRDVWFFETLVEVLERKLRLRNRVGFEALIEETEALARIEDIAVSSPRLEALILGFGDLSASQGVRLGMVGAYPGDFWHYARGRVVVAARAAGIDAVDGPFANFHDAEGYRQEATRASIFGFVGKWAIHPSQIGIANEVFAPTDEEIATAKKMLEAVRVAGSGGAGAAGVDGNLIDAATARIFEGVLERARRAGRL